METYGARISFLTEFITAESQEKVEEKLIELIDQLGQIQTELSWDNVDWNIYEVEEN
jgi:hypothetical protein